MASQQDMVDFYMSQNQGPHILWATWLMTSLATLVVAGRFYIRYSVIKRGGADDWWMLAGVSFLCALTAIITAMAQIGGFKHESTLDAATIVQVKRLFWAAQPIGLLGSLLPKISIGLQLLYILPNSQAFRWQRYLVWLCLAVSGVVNLLVFPMVFARCAPTSALWTGQGQCWSTEVDTVYFLVAALVNAVVDLVFVALPIGIIMGLKISFMNKALLVNFLGARIFAFIAGVVKASFIAKDGFADKDLTWYAFDFLLWQCAEQFCLCFCGSFPTYKAVFDRWLRKRASLKASSAYSYGSRPGSAQSNWFYERKCFEKKNNSSIVVTTDIEVQHERLGSEEELTATPVTPVAKSNMRVMEASVY